MNNVVLILNLWFTPVDWKPDVADLARFPSAPQAVEMISFLAHHQIWIERQKRAEYRSWHRKKWDDWLAECLETEYAWVCLFNAHDSRWTLTNRLNYLGDLRKAIGDENYYSGQMPVKVLRRFVQE